MVPLYEYAGDSTLASDWANACANDALVVANGANSGAPTSSDSDWSYEEGDLAPAMANCYSHGSVRGQALGYIDTAYGDTSVGTVEQQMQEWISFDPSVAGFFFDDADSSSTSQN
ncbi:MAG TPA: spherulation-specific family 4 protein, partial [Acidimicrobiales bacterium]|nr:spherulation-specific family 4 protein [Acidimicrobiales bacterium]